MRVSSERCVSGLPLVVLHLHQPDIAHHGHVAQQADVGRAEGEVVSAADAAAVEVEAVEVHPLDQLAARFRLERRERRIAQFLVRLPVALGDAAEQAAVEFQEGVDGRCFVAHDDFSSNSLSTWPPGPDCRWPGRAGPAPGAP